MDRSCFTRTQNMLNFAPIEGSGLVLQDMQNWLSNCQIANTVCLPFDTASTKMLIKSKFWSLESTSEILNCRSYEYH